MRTASLLAVCAFLVSRSFQPGPWGWLAWFALAPYLWAVRESASPRQAFLRGWFFGALCWAFGMPWLARVCRDFLSLPAAASWAAAAAGCAAQGLMPAAAAWAARRVAGPLERRLGSAAFPLAAVTALLALDGTFPYLFPTRWADSQHGHPAMLQIAGLLGPGAVALPVFLLNAGLEALWRSRRAWRLAAAGAVLLGANLAYGRARLARVDAETRALMARGRSLRVVLLQSGVSSRAKRDPARVEANVATHRRLIGEALSAGPADLVVWPETAYTRTVNRFLGVPTIGEKLRPFEEVFSEDIPYRVPMMVGVVEWDHPSAWRRNRSSVQASLHNEAILVDSSGRPIGAAVKRHLMPFGEYMPLAETFPWLRRLSPNTGRFSPGRGAALLTLPSGARLAALICYEDVIDSYSRESAALGADLLVNMTSTELLGREASELQLLRAARQAVQTRRWMARAVSSGVSAVIDPAGRVVARLPFGEVGALRAEVALPEERAPYLSIGEALCRAAALLFAASAVLAWRAERRRG